MNRCLKISILSVAIFSFSFSSQADGIHPYAGAGVGAFLLDTGISGVGNQTAFGGFGQFGIDFGDFVGVEVRAGSTTSSTFQYLGVDLSLRLDYFVSYLAKLQFPVTDNFRIYALGGGTTAKASASVSIPGTILALSGSNTSSSGSFGGGVDFQIQDQWRIGAEFLHYASDVDGVTANIKFLF